MNNVLLNVGIMYAYTVYLLSISIATEPRLTFPITMGFCVFTGLATWDICSKTLK